MIAHMLYSSRLILSSPMLFVFQIFIISTFDYMSYVCVLQINFSHVKDITLYESWPKCYLLHNEYIYVLYVMHFKG